MSKKEELRRQAEQTQQRLKRADKLTSGLASEGVRWKAAVIESGARAAIAEEVPFAEEPIRAAIKRVASHHAGGRVVINLETTGTGTG